MKKNTFVHLARRSVFPARVNRCEQCDTCRLDRFVQQLSKQNWRAIASSPLFQAYNAEVFSTFCPIYCLTNANGGFIHETRVRNLQLESCTYFSQKYNFAYS